MHPNYLSIDIGGTNIKSAIIDRSGNILSKKRKKTPQEFTAFLAVLKQIIQDSHEEIRGIAISTPGKVNSDTGTIYFGGALPFLNGVSLKKIFEKSYNIPVTVTNDGKAAALAELWLGNLQDIENGAAITLGTGLGGGVIINGTLVQGTHFQAGELSFMLKPEANQLKIENLFGFSGSAVAMIRKAAIVLGIEDLTDGETVFEAINRKDPAVYDLFSGYCREIAYVIANVQAVVDLECFVIGGGISAQPIVIEEIQRQYQKLHDSLPIIKHTLTSPQIKACKFQNEANLLGALYQFLLTWDQKNVRL